MVVPKGSLEQKLQLGRIPKLGIEGESPVISPYSLLSTIPVNAKCCLVSLQRTKIMTKEDAPADP